MAMGQYKVYEIKQNILRQTTMRPMYFVPK